MSTPFGQLFKFSEQMTDAGVDHFQVMLDSGYFPAIRKAVVDGLALPSRDEFAQFIGLSSLHPSMTELPGIVIPDDATIETLIRAGEYDSQSDDAREYLTDERFKITVHGPRNLFLAHFNKKVTSEHVEVVARKMGYEVALVEDLLCVGAHSEHRKLQLQFPIIALGSSTNVDGSRRMSYLSRWRDGKYLNLCSCDHEWGAIVAFLLVGKDKLSDA